MTAGVLPGTEIHGLHLDGDRGVRGVPGEGGQPVGEHWGDGHTRPCHGHLGSLLVDLLNSL